MKVFLGFVFVLQIAVYAAQSTDSDHCPPRDCTKEFTPVCAKDPETGAEKTYANNCTRLFLGCRHIYLRDGKCKDDWMMLKEIAGVGENVTLAVARQILMSQCHLKNPPSRRALWACANTSLQRLVNATESIYSSFASYYKHLMQPKPERRASHGRRAATPLVHQLKKF